MAIYKMGRNPWSAYNLPRMLLPRNNNVAVMNIKGIACPCEAIAWTNVDISPLEICGIPLGVISREMLKISVSGTRFKIINLIFPHTGADQLTDIGSLLNYKSQSGCTWTHAA